ncbi:enoyl-CoA hydratase [Natronomonas pharaonis DSM 2160]|uniref:Enoyl-CoA hydratase n=1 Tax=Natronomonas pharaonis (strain ATCC 35678 / DSM 2160 / CIP 103997 / JCM 8858 / NBRC 14720 / NCIMB 2260 / Gabara) TaxID=348780 RepID=A0A1U7EWS6_NATPD|nr:enoyl-CoA hydratase-related protein [Natronomonas pharaonis]CAI49559.1 enoyl-CoA hydratase [Natronomonas pharaonis DSM 2160]
MERHDAASTEAVAVRVSEDDLVIRATIERPERQNALNDAVIEGLTAAFDLAAETPARVVVLRGAGGTFCAGGDIESMAAAIGSGSMAYREGFAGMRRLIEAAVDAPALTVAAVEGYCLAGGMGLAAACDVVIAADDTTFGLPEVDIGLFPAQALVPIMRTVTEKRAFKLLFTGEHIDAATAHDIGLTTAVVPADEFEAAIDTTVDDLTAASPAAVELGKEAFYNQREMGFREALDYMHEVVTLVAMSDDAESGINGYLTDSEPGWDRRTEGV